MGACSALEEENRPYRHTPCKRGSQSVQKEMDSRTLVQVMFDLMNDGLRTGVRG